MSAAKSRGIGVFVMMVLCALGMSLSAASQGKPTQAHVAAKKAQGKEARPKLVVMIVVDQMRGDYVDKFLAQWTGGFKRLVERDAWFRDAAYPYAATETCVGHATISTGALPATHGIVANAWWDRDSGKMITCTADPKAEDIGYGSTVKGGDTAWRLLVPTFAEELKFQSGSGTRVVTFSLKARAAIMLAGHKADAATWFDSGQGIWETSNAYGTQPFIAEYVKAHPVKTDYGKTWALSLPKSAYLYKEESSGAVAPEGWSLGFPHPVRGKASGSEPDGTFYEQWDTSPFADTYLTKLAETAVDQLGLGQKSGTDFLGVSYSSVDYVGHAFGPRSWEIQDILVRLDRDLGELFAHLDAEVGRGNYLVALSADHGVAPIPEDMERTGADTGVLHLPEVQENIERALEPFNYPKPAVAKIAGADVYLAKGIYKSLRADRNAMHAVLDAIRSTPGVANVYRSNELYDRPATDSPIRNAEADSYFPGRSGDLLIVPKPYWLMVNSPAGRSRNFGTSHGTPYNYDQHVPLFLMGWGIRAGEYHGTATPADIAPTLASLCGITLAPRDGRVLAEALARARATRSSDKP
jgi:predicted AlkP superfamily pyrophosphatase or phosphodiesterase